MKPSKNLWPLGIILTFVVFITGTVCLVVMASTQRVDLVNTNYYEQEIKYQSHIESQGRAQELGHDASILYEASLKSIVITLPKEQIQSGVTGRIQLYRPSIAGLDREFALDMSHSNVQSLDVSELQRGLWKVRLNWTANGQDFFLEQKIVIKDR